MLAVREATTDDVLFIADYWLCSDSEYLQSLGVDIGKLPTREGFVNMLLGQVALPIEERQSYALVWLVDNEPVGHCNINSIKAGEEAYMHLHIWKQEHRNAGIGLPLVKMSIPHFFRSYNLKRLYCEPFADNEAPHRLLQKVGFKLDKEYITIPGNICFEQPVKRWVLE